MKLHKHYQRTNYLKYSLANTGAEICNKLNQNLKNIASSSIFLVSSIQEKVEETYRIYLKSSNIQ